MKDQPNQTPSSNRERIKRLEGVFKNLLIAAAAVPLVLTITPKVMAVDTGAVPSAQINKSEIQKTTLESISPDLLTQFMKQSVRLPVLDLKDPNSGAPITAIQFRINGETYLVIEELNDAQVINSFDIDLTQHPTLSKLLRNAKSEDWGKNQQSYIGNGGMAGEGNAGIYIVGVKAIKTPVVK